MNKIEQLLNELCPDGIEFKELSEIAEITIGEFMHKNNQNPNGEYPVFNGGISETGFYDEFNNTGDKIIVSARGANAGYVNKIFKKYWAGNSCYTIDIKDKNNVDWIFVFYYLKNNQNKLTGEQQKGGIPAVSKKQMEKIQIPIPPIEIQKEIVKILDTFTELEAELEARKKQYEYYRDELFFNKEYHNITFDKICTINQGLQVPISDRKTEPGENRYFYITVQFLKNNIENFYIENPGKNVICNENDILVTRTGSTGKIITGVKGCFHNNFFKLNCNEDIENKYIYHLLSSKKMYNKMLSSASGGTVPDLTHSAFYKISIPVPFKNGKPDLEKQQEIVAILDKFDALVNDISFGLPAEIKARKQQYEYYREKLLTFKPL